MVHLHLLGIQFHWCKPHPASVWLIPLWSISGRHHRYCLSPHCTAKQFQISSVEIEKSIDILSSGAIMYTMNILILLFSMCHLCATFYWCSLGLIGFSLMLGKCERWGSVNLWPSRFLFFGGFFCALSI